MVRAPLQSSKHRQWGDIALVAACALIPLALFLVVIWQDRLQLKRQAQAEVKTSVDGIENQVLRFYQTDEVIAELVGAQIRSMSWNEIGGSAFVHDYLRGLKARFPQIQAVSLFDNDGVLRNSSQSNPPPDVRMDMAREDFIDARSDASDLLVSRIVSGGAYLPDAHFDVAHYRSSRQGPRDGLIVLSISPEYFRSDWGRGPPGTLNEIMRVDLNILARVPPAPAEKVQPLADFTGASAASEEGSFRQVSRTDGIERLYAFRRVTPYNVFVVGGINWDRVLARWRTHLLTYGSFFLVAAIALTTMALAAIERARRARVATAQWQQATERLMDETRRLRTTEKQLYHVEKMEALGQVTSGFAHDFNNILTSILLTLGLLRGTQRDANAEQRLGEVVDDAERAQKAMNSLLVFARRGDFVFETVDLKTLLGQAETLLHSAVGPNIDLEITCAADIWPVESDANQLELALLNLAINARDAMPNGGKVQIAAANASLALTPRGLSGEFVALSVMDTGLGMPPEVAAKAIEPFFTTKEKNKGTGLGLSQVYGIAARSGTMTLESEVGHGTTVTIYLRRAASPEHKVERVKHPEIGAVEPMAGKSTSNQCRLPDSPSELNLTRED